MNKITFSKHALAQLTERDITKAEVRNAIISPDSIVAQSSKRFRIAKKYASSKYALVVVYEQRQSDKEIVTIFRTSKLRKYL